jgi:prepilin-type N-terminal cleavage/methylation domain-containing protein
LARKIKGFSLIELLFVIVIMAIMFGIGVPKVIEWNKKFDIESKTKKIEVLVKEAKLKAFTEKKELTIEKNSSQDVCIKENTNYILCVKGTKDFKINNTLNISKRGTATKATIYYYKSNKAKYDCVKASSILVKVDKCNGTP